MSESTGSPASKFYRVVATFGHPSFDPIEMVGAKWFGLIEVAPEDTATLARIEKAGIQELPAEEAVEYRAKKQQQPGSSAPLYVLPPSGHNRTLPAQAAPAAPTHSDTEVETAIAVRNVRKGSK